MLLIPAYAYFHKHFPENMFQSNWICKNSTTYVWFVFSLFRQNVFLPDYSLCALMVSRRACPELLPWAQIRRWSRLGRASLLHRTWVGSWREVNWSEPLPLELAIVTKLISYHCSDFQPLISWQHKLIGLSSECSCHLWHYMTFGTEETALWTARK